MKNRFSRLLLVGLAGTFLGLSPEPAVAQVEGSAPFSSAGTTAPAVSKFLKKLKAAVADEDADAVAAMVSYPLKAWDGKKTVNVKSKAQFVKLYPAIFGEEDLLELIADASVATTFANYQGVMLGSGRLWFGADESDVLRIIAINPPE